MTGDLRFEARDIARTPTFLLVVVMILARHRRDNGNLQRGRLTRLIAGLLQRL